MPPRPQHVWPEFPGDPHGHPILPPLRTFLVTRIDPRKPLEFYDEVMEAHRYYTDPSGALCFEQLVYLIKDRTVTTRIPKSMAPGTWFDAKETTVFNSMRPAHSLQ